MHVSAVSLNAMAATLEIKDLKPFVRPEGTFAWILLKAGEAGSQTRLVVGDVKYHEDLFLFWRVQEEKNNDEPRKRWAAFKAKNAELRDKFRPNVLASGVIDRKGHPESWESKWFTKQTPEGMKEFLLAELISAIRMYFPEGMKKRANG